MSRRRRLRFAYLLGSLLLLGASLHAPTAYSAAGDPPSGSPAGAVYQLPLEQGRADGAPKGSGGTAAGVGGGGGPTQSGGGGATGSGGGGEQAESGSLYRSENNFGSSSQVPGVAAGAGGGTAGGGTAGGTAGSGGAAGGSTGGANAANPSIANSVPDAGNTSVSATIVLLGAVALLATSIGVLSRRFTRGRAAA